MTIRDIVVGVDGSTESDAALRWAAHEAQRHGARLTVLHAHDPIQHAFDTPLEEVYERGLVRIAKVIVDSAVAEVRSLEPAVRVHGETSSGAAAAALIRASGAGARVVVGSRGRGGFTGLLLGSVSQHVATHAAGPVVVVRAEPGRPDGPVVVGVDESDASGHVLDVAFEEAALRDARIVVLHAYLPDVRTWGLDLPPEVEDEGVRRTLEADRLSEIVRPWRRAFPTVDVEVTAAEGQAAARLVAASAPAQLIVVGSRGRGGFTGLLLGSVGLQLLHHSACPVLIARESSTGSVGGVR
jgi:nucleotide-binding universal stress UspA family protein